MATSLEKQETKEKQESSLRTPLWSTASTLLWLLLVNFFYTSSLGRDLNNRLATTLEFQVREALGKSPALDPRVRIFGFDDKTLSVLQRPEFYIEEWAVAIRRLAQDRPKVIIIDKIFSIIYDPNHKIEAALDVLREVKVPVVVGSFVTPQHIPFRHELDLRKKLYHLPTLAREGLSLKGGIEAARVLQEKVPDTALAEQRQQIPQISKGNDAFAFLKDFRSQYLYGPAPALVEAFTYVGHLQYSGHTKVAPFLRLSDTYAVPHASLFAADFLGINADGVKVNDQVLALDADGDVVANLAHPKAYYKDQKRLGLALTRGNKRLVKEGDVVLLLLNMYTGGTDFHLTPFGYAPGGFILASMINSALTGKWLKTIHFPWLLLSGACILGAALGIFAGSLVFWLSIFSGLLFCVALGLLSFSYAGVIVPWLWVSLGFVGTAVTIFADKSRYTEKRAQQLKLVEAERRFFEKELKDAAIMAEAYKPDIWPNWPALLVGGFHKPIMAASGDWFAFVAAKSRPLYHVIMCDITGHGVQAALVVSACKTLLGNIRSLRPELCEQPDFILHYMRYLNTVLWQQGQGQHVTTLLGLSFMPEEKKLTYVAGGHPSPLVRRSEQWQEKVQPLISRHNPLGLSADCEPALSEVDFNPGDEILAFTDGVPLLENRRVLKKFPTRSVDNITSGTLELYEKSWDLETAKSGRKPDDDVSMVWIKAL